MAAAVVTSEAANFSPISLSCYVALECIKFVFSPCCCLWFKPLDLQVAAVYMSSRLFVNLSQVFIPLYLHETLQMAAQALAIVPLIMFLSSFCTSFLIEFINRKLGRKVSIKFLNTQNSRRCTSFYITVQILPHIENLILPYANKKLNIFIKCFLGYLVIYRWLYFKKYEFLL